MCRNISSHFIAFAVSRLSVLYTPVLALLLTALLSAPALPAFSAPVLQSPVLSAPTSETHAQNIYGHYAGMPQSLSGLIAPSDCRGGELCVTRSGSGATPATTRYNAYVYSKSNPSGRISASYVVDGSKTLVSGFSLAYRTDGQVASKETFAASGDGMTCERTVYGYDALGRLSSEDRRSCGAAALPQSGTTDLSYDASGNTVLERAGTGALTTTTYTGRDRIRAHCTGTACRHPRYGARGGILGDGSERFVYTDEARLSSRYAGSQGKAYRYLPDGLLWETQAGGASGVYLYRAGDELSGRARLESSGVEETSHNFWFDGLDARTVTHDGSFSGFDYGFSDYMGSVLTETDGHGETRGLRRYGHAGDPLSSPGAQGDALASWPLSYSEGYEDRLGGAHALTFFGVREQEGGRFLEADTDLRQPNAYVYAADNWPNRVDMTGHAAEPVFAGEGVYGESSSATDLPTCDELNPDCQMPALPDEGGGGDGKKTAGMALASKFVLEPGGSFVSQTLSNIKKGQRLTKNKTSQYPNVKYETLSKRTCIMKTLRKRKWEVVGGMGPRIAFGGIFLLVQALRKDRTLDPKTIVMTGVSVIGAAVATVLNVTQPALRLIEMLSVTLTAIPGPAVDYFWSTTESDDKKAGALGMGILSLFAATQGLRFGKAIGRDNVLETIKDWFL